MVPPSSWIQLGVPFMTRADLHISQPNNTDFSENRAFVQETIGLSVISTQLLGDPCFLSKIV